MASVGDFVIMGVDGVFGYRYSSFLELGARVSLLSFDCMNGEDSKKSLAVPVMAHLSTNILPHSLVSPFVSLDCGYSIGLKDGKDSWYDDYEDSKFKTSGLCYEASAGLGFDVVSARMKIAFFYRRNSIQYININPDYNFMDRCYGLKLGLSF